RQCQRILPTVDTANRPWPTSVAPRRVSSDRVARGPVAPRKMACRPLAGKASISGSRLSTRARGAAWSLPLSIGSENGRQAARPCFARRPVALRHEDHMPTHGYEPTREAAMGSHQRRARRCRLQLRPAPALAQHPLLGELTTRFFISKIFSQKIWPKKLGRVL